MGFLDSLKSMAGSMADQEPHEAFGSLLEKTPLGSMSGLLDHLKEGGLGEEVEAWCQGDHSGVTPDQIKDALGDEHLQHIASSLGVSPDEAAQHLSEHLPEMAEAHASDTDHSDDESSADQEEEVPAES